jgi:hypothetical protein
LTAKEVIKEMNNMRNRLALLSVLLLILFSITLSSALAQGGITVVTDEYETVFGETITFRVAAESESEITDIRLYYQVGGFPVTSRAEPEFELGQTVEAEHEWDLVLNYTPPGSEIAYWWKIEDAAGNELETEPVSFTYEDERYDWQELSSDQILLYWYRGDDDFGQALLDRGLEALDQLSRDTGVTVEKAVKIFIYGSHSDLLGALDQGAREWTGGRAFTDQGIVLIGVSPSNLEWGKRATVHELTHVVVHRVTDTPLGGLPTWLDEGLAMYAEGDLEPVYVAELNEAAESNTLISVRSLSSSFSADSDLAGLSYAESYSLVEFILDQYGEEKLTQLIDIFTEGAYYDDALQEALGVDTDGLEDEWRAWLGAPPRPTSVEVTPQISQPSGPTPVTQKPSGEELCCLGGLAPGAILLALFYLFRPKATQG